MSLNSPIRLPPVVEAYRDAVIAQLYMGVTTAFQSVCWAGTERDKRPEDQSHIVFFPGEEEFIGKNWGVNFKISECASKCSHRREETSTRKKIIPDGEGGEQEVEVPKVNHFCTLHPKAGRPILCRTWPFSVNRIPGEDRKADIVVLAEMMGPMSRQFGEQAFNQAAHDVAQIFVAMWNFLTPAWWTEFELNRKGNYVSMADFTFELDDDTILSFVRGAPPVWRKKILDQIADPKCMTCEGQGIEFWDRIKDPKTGRTVPAPVGDRRFDLCRVCVLPQIGSAIGGQLVDRSNSKLLTPDGKVYRGD